jgi:transposase
MTRKPPEIIEVNRGQMEELLDRASSNTLREEDTELLRQIFDSYTQFFQIVGDKKTSISRLRKLLFGSPTEKTKHVLGELSPAEAAGHRDLDEADGDRSAGDEPTRQRPQRPGHGRRSADDYEGAQHVEVPHAELSEGDPCPACKGGKLYEKTPRVVVRIVGQPPLGATVYRLQKLRFHLCGQIFTASEPEGTGTTKYDATAASMIGLLKYGAGLPFNRLERLQQSCQIPLPASTQWHVLSAVTPQILPAYEWLIREAAQGDVLHNDDTTIKILELMKERAEQKLGEEADERTGIFTSGVVATRENQRIALFFSGRQHAGENLGDVLQHRAAELTAPIQMSDGLSRNLPKDLETIVANCLAHARRKFVDVYDRFSDECRYVLESLKVVYQNDKIARRQKMSPEKRLRHHRIKSQQTMNRLHHWLKRQLDDQRVEPNSALGEAIHYMLKRWDALTLFLREPGAPLDNNLVERALKKAILHRKNSLFYKTQRGATVGDMFMSLIYTCELCRVNPFQYLTELQRHADEVAAHPERWMPWNYADALAATTNAG